MVGLLHLLWPRMLGFNLIRGHLTAEKRDGLILLLLFLSYFSLGFRILSLYSLELEKKIEGKLWLWRFEDWDTIGELPFVA